MGDGVGGASRVVHVWWAAAAADLPAKISPFPAKISPFPPRFRVQSTLTPDRRNNQPTTNKATNSVDHDEIFM